MKVRGKRITALFAALIMLLSVTAGLPLCAPAYEASGQSLAAVSTSDWMSVLLDGTRLTEITMPGTHDSCARKFKDEDIFGVTSGIAKCQSMNITEQLNAGVRFLDIRCEVDPNSYSVKTVHGTTDCWNGNDYYYLDFVFQDVYNWLDAHPSETVCICIKEDDGDHGVPAFTNAIYEYIHGYGQGKYFYGEEYNYRDRWYLGKSVPTLGAVRGKCVLFNRFDQYISTESGQGVVADENESGQKIKYNDFSDSDYKEPCYEEVYSYNTGIGTAHIQDHYKWNTESKVRATQYMLNLAHCRGEYYINYSSTVSDSSVPNPENLSKKINPNYYSFNYTRNKPSGIYCMDFANADLARCIILNNEAVCARLEADSGSLHYVLDRSAGTLTVSGSGAMDDFAYTNTVGAFGSGSTAPWGDAPQNCLFEGQYNTDFVTQIIIEEGVTSIGAYAFYGFDRLQSVSIPDSVQSIGEGAFARCTSIKKIDISRTAVTSVGTLAFLGCTALEEFYTADGVQSIGENAFGNCSRLTMFGSSGIPSQTYAAANGIAYSAPVPFYSVNANSGNRYLETQNPFAGRDLSGGVTICFSKYCTADDDWNSALLSFSTGNTADNRYFIFMGNGAVFFNDGNDGAGDSNHCYFDIRTNNAFNTAADRWVDVTVTIYKDNNGNHRLDYYADGALIAAFNLSSVCADGYPHGVSGDDGVFSYLASSDIQLYYGASYTVYGSMGGTADAYIDDVRCYAAALSPQEIGAADTSLLYTQRFDADMGGIGTTRQSNDGTAVAWQEYNDGRSGAAFLPFSDGGNGNYIATGVSPFAGCGTQNGFTVSYFQRVNGNLWTDKESITFAQGDTAQCKYFTLGTEGYIRFNNGNGGTDGSLSNAGLYFDHTVQNAAFTKGVWQLITVSILSDRRFKVYVNGTLTADITANGTEQYNSAGGLLAFLASPSTTLYYGSYTPYWGTDTISLDNVRCFNRALAAGEVAALYRTECESTLRPALENTFGADCAQQRSGFCEWLYGMGTRRGLLHFNAGSADGDTTIYINGVQAYSTAHIPQGSTVKAVYTGSGSIAGWQNTVTCEGTAEVNTSSAQAYEFTLQGDSVLHYIGTATQYNSDISAFDAATEKAQGYRSEDYSADSFAQLQQTLAAYAAINDTMPQEQIDDATAAILTAISELKPYLNLNVAAQHGTTNRVGGQYVFGDSITVTVTPETGFRFLGWYEQKTRRIASAEESYTFTITSNTDFLALCVPQDTAVLTFANVSGQVEQITDKTPQEWAQVTDISALAPAVPYRYGYENGRWAFDSDALSRLQNGEDVTVTPAYDEAQSELPPLPACTDKPALTLTCVPNTANGIATFMMALNVPQGVRLQAIGTAFCNGKAGSFAPDEFDLTVNNKTATSKFAVTEAPCGVYVTNIHHFTSRYSWAARGYAVYYDETGKLRTVYSNQVNIIQQGTVPN